MVVYGVPGGSVFFKPWCREFGDIFRETIKQQTVVSFWCISYWIVFNPRHLAPDAIRSESMSWLSMFFETVCEINNYSLYLSTIDIVFAFLTMQQRTCHMKILHTRINVMLYLTTPLQKNAASRGMVQYMSRGPSKLSFITPKFALVYLSVLNNNVIWNETC